MAFETILMALFGGLVVFSLILYFFSQSMHSFFKNTKDRTGEIHGFLQQFISAARSMKEESYEKVSKSMVDKRLAGALSAEAGEKTVLVAVAGSGRQVKKGG